MMGPQRFPAALTAEPPLLSPPVLRALASPTRASILRALSERPHTPAELSRRVGVSDPTVRSHLEVLKQAGLATRRADERVWAYHELTETGRRLLSGSLRVPRLFLIGGAAGAAAGITLLLERARRLPDPPPPPDPFTLPMPAPEMPLDPLLPWLFGGGLGLLAVGGLVLAGGAYALWWRARARGRARSG